MKKLGLTLSLLACAFIASSQGNFKAGYVVLNSGDTLRGEIESGNWATNPESINFRGAEVSQRYAINLLRAFGVGDQLQYVRFTFTYQPSVTELADATESFGSSTETKQAWLRLLYKSKYSLYEWSAPKRKYYFIEGPGQGIQELVYRVRLTPTGELQKDEQFKNLLILYARNEGTEKPVERQLSNANYDDRSLLKAFDLLNGEKSSFKDAADGRSRFDISGGATIHTFKAGGSLYNDGSGAYALYNGEFKSSFGFVIGFGFTYISKKSSTVQPRFGLNLASISIDGQNTKGGGGFQKETYKGSMLLAEPNINIDFLLGPAKKTSFFAGLTFGYNIIISNNLSSSFENPGVVITKDEFPPASGGFINVGISATANGSWGRLNLRACSRSNIFNSDQTKLTGGSFSLTYGYYLKK